MLINIIRFKEILKKRVFIFLILILSLGLLLRSWDYLRGDFNYFIDQSRDLLLVKQIVEEKPLMLIGARAGLQGIFHGPLWLYFLVPTYILSQGDPFWTMVPVFTIINILLILVAFLVGRKLYGNNVGLLTAFFIAVSNPIIEASFTITNAHLVMILFLVYLYYAISYLRGSSVASMALIFITGLTFQFESAFAVFLAPLTGVILLLNKKIIKWKFVFIGAGLFLINVSNFILFELRHQFLMTSSALRLLSGKSGLMPGYEYYQNIFFRAYDRLIHLIKFFLIPLYDSNLFLKIITLAVIIYALFKFKNKKLKLSFKKEFIYLYSLPFIYFFFYIFYPYPIWGHYLFGMMVLSCFLMALTLNFLDNGFDKKIVKGFIILVLIFPSLWIIKQYSFFYKGDLGSYRTQKQIAEWVIKDSQDKKIGYFAYDPGMLTYNMDYLIPYIASKNNKVAVNEKTDIIYLVMYAAPKWNLADHDYWMKNVIKTNGQILETKKFKGTDLIIRKVKTEKNEPSPDPNYFQNLIFR